jgi:hypothetical protein
VLYSELARNCNLNPNEVWDDATRFYGLEVTHNQFIAICMIKLAQKIEALEANERSRESRE